MKKGIATSGTLPDAGALRLVLTLSLAGLLSGFIIVAAYQTTLPAIEAYQAEQLRLAVFKVLPGVARIQRMIYQDGKMVASEDDKNDAVYAGYDANGQLVGYAIPAAGPGFQDTIKLIFGYLPTSRTIISMEVLDSRETPGLGDKIYKDADFVANFDKLAIDPEIVAVKKGKKAKPNEIDAITGATISSKAVVRIINEANKIWAPRLNAGEG
jgi:electron transport complex protein RnfG